jgi:hypothetical protein
MPVIQFNTVNLSSLLVPGAYVQVEQPTAAAIVGAPTSILAVVGTGTWGPVNSPTAFGNPQQGAAIFGQPSNRKYDLMTHVSTAALQGANNFKGVRVTDGTDLAATVEILTNCLALTSKYTGTGGNGITATVSAGSQYNTWRVIVFMPGVTPETFDNIGFGLSGNALWLAFAAAINNGTNIQRGPSQMLVASAGAGTSAPTASTYGLSGGTDGASGVTAATLIGSDSATPRTGMYALRNSQSSLALLSDCDTSSTWTTQVAYGLSEGTYMIGTGPSGDSIANAITTLQTAGINSYAFKYMQGDWIYWQDPVNGQRVVSPQGFVAGFLANSTPNQPALNQQLYGIIGTQKSIDQQVYAPSDLAALAQAGIDCIANPSPGGNYFSCFLGHNTSSNPLINSDSYTRMTNFEAYSLNGPSGLGQFIGDLNNQTEQSDAVGAVSAFLQAQWDNGLIGNSANPGAIPFSVTLPGAQNTQQQTALGFQYMLIEITYWAIVERLIATVIGGASVVITSQSVSPAV